MLNFLSIDWDYFVMANAGERLRHFPDIPNENYPQSLQYAIWASRYAGDETLPLIGANPFAYRLADILRYVPKIYVCDSHKYAYTFAVQEMRERHETKINLLNIDYHSDYRKDIDKLDCGNWLSVLMNEYKGCFQWLGQRDSYRGDKPKDLKMVTDFPKSGIYKTKWDVLFICRSDMWSPPHLDDEFTKVFYRLTLHKDGQIQKDIWKSRYEKMLPEIEKMKETLKEFKRRM